MNTELILERSGKALYAGVFMLASFVANDAFAEGQFPAQVTSDCAAFGGVKASIGTVGCATCHTTEYAKPMTTGTTLGLAFQSSGNKATVANGWCAGVTTTTPPTTTTAATTSTTRATTTTTAATTSTTRATTTTTAATTSTTRATTTSTAPTTTTTTAATTTTTGSTTTTTLPRCTRKNKAPILKVPAEVNATVNMPVDVTAKAYDTDGRVVSLVARVSRRTVALTDAGAEYPYTIAKTYQWVPSEEGTERKVTFTAKDNCGKTMSATSTIHVSEGSEDDSESESSDDDDKTSSNAAPTLSVLENVTAAPGSTVTIPVIAVDSEGDKVSLSVGSSSGATLAKKASKRGVAKADLTVTAPAIAGETSTVTVKAKDDAQNGQSVTKTIRVHAK